MMKGGKGMGGWIVEGGKGGRGKMESVERRSVSSLFRFREVAASGFQIWKF